MRMQSARMPRRDHTGERRQQPCACGGRRALNAGPPAAQVADDLNPVRVLALLRAVRGTELELLDLACRPEHLLMSHLPVPPVCIRPSVEMDTGAGSNEDDITMKLMARARRARPPPATCVPARPAIFHQREMRGTRFMRARLTVRRPARRPARRPRRRSCPATFSSEARAARA
jgi:hypothetical protein